MDGFFWKKEEIFGSFQNRHQTVGMANPGTAEIGDKNNGPRDKMRNSRRV